MKLTTSQWVIILVLSLSGCSVFSFGGGFLYRSASIGTPPSRLEDPSPRTEPAAASKPTASPSQQTQPAASATTEKQFVVSNVVKVIDWAWYERAGGTLYVDGQMQNVSQKTISRITINVALYDTKGALLATDKNLDAFTFSLAPGQIGNFKIVTNSRAGTQTVKITSITWSE